MRTGTKKLFSLLVVIAMALSMLPSSTLPVAAAQTKLEDSDGMAYCEHCKKVTQWTPYDKATHGGSGGLGGNWHLYLTQDTTLTEGGAVIAWGSVCFHLNGCSLTSTATSNAALFQGSVNVMGDGIVTCAPNDAAFHINLQNAAANSNIYGGTYKRNSNIPIIRIWGNGGTVNFYGGTVDAADSKTQPAVELQGTSGKIATFSMPGGKILAGSACDAVAIKNSYSKLNVTGGIIDGYISGTTANAVASDGYIKQTSGNKIAILKIAAVVKNSSGTVTGTYTALADAIAKAGASDTVVLKAVTENEYVQLSKDVSIDMGDRDAFYVDLNGHKLNLTGSGDLYAIDTANDSYALTDGAVTAADTIDVKMDVKADGKRYIGLTETDGSISFHRLEVGVGYVTLRTTEAGLYFKAQYNCDTDLINAAQVYGVVASLNNMPGEDFKNEYDVNKATAYYTAENPLVSGQVVESGSIFGIMKTSRTAKLNDAYGQMKIYANPYLELADGRIIMCDTENAGKTASDPGFDGIAYSLYDAMKALETKWYDTSVATDSVKDQINTFYNDWAPYGMSNWKEGLPNIATLGESDAPYLQVGYGKASITPDFSVGLSGHSTESTRKSQGVESDVYATCIAALEGGERALLYTIDMCGLYEEDWGVLRWEIYKATGIPEHRILIAATHTHSAPGITGAEDGQKFLALLKEQVVAAAKAALKDRAPASIETASGEIQGMNFIRHYLMKDGTYAGPNFGATQTNSMTWLDVRGYAYEADHEMVLVKFNRSGTDKKDVVMVNWSAHPANNAEIGTYLISPDFIGPLRDELEQLSGTQVAYFTAADGDVVYDTWYMEERHYMAWDEYGTKMGQYAYDILQTCQPLEGTGMRSATNLYPAKIEHSKDYLINEAQEVAELWNTDSAAANTLARSYGFSNALEARMVVSRYRKGETENRETSVLRIGGLGIISCNYEMSSINGMYIKDNSPFETTFILTGNHGYIPYAGAYDYPTEEGQGAYEANTSLFTRGTAEELADEYVRLLNKVNNN